MKARKRPQDYLTWGLLYPVPPIESGVWHHQYALKHLAEMAARGSTAAGIEARRLKPEDKAYVWATLPLWGIKDLFCAAMAITEDRIDA
jgi:hypothetical protein